MGNPEKAHIFAMPVKCLNTAVNSQKYLERPLVLQIPHIRNCVVKLPLTLLGKSWRSLRENVPNAMRFTVTSVFSLSQQKRDCSISVSATAGTQAHPMLCHHCLLHKVALNRK